MLTKIKRYLLTMFLSETCASAHQVQVLPHLFLTEAASTFLWDKKKTIKLWKMLKTTIPVWFVDANHQAFLNLVNNYSLIFRSQNYESVNYFVNERLNNISHIDWSSPHLNDEINWNSNRFREKETRYINLMFTGIESRLTFKFVNTNVRSLKKNRKHFISGQSLHWMCIKCKNFYYLLLIYYVIVLLKFAKDEKVNKHTNTCIFIPMCFKTIQSCGEICIV